MEEKAAPVTEALSLICPTCGARYTLPKYVEGQRYGCKRCSASLLFGKFALQQELGRGGFGVVYKAFQADLMRVVALKFLHTDSEESTERFMREARIAANLNHPNITAIYEVGSHEGKPYITMQFVDGVTTNKASFTIREAVMVLRDAAIAVDYAHAREIVHRDLKPHNIMVTQERSGTSPSETTRRTFVMDFGLARSSNRGGTLTTEGQVMGTPAFMSPEQAEGRTCDSRSDVYSLGATLYSLVTKRPPFEAPTPLQILMAVTQEDPAPPSKYNPEIDAGLESIILKAMAKDPGQRYPSASRLAQDLTTWLAGGVTDAGPTLHLSATPGSLTRISGKKASGPLIAIGAALLVAGAGGFAWQLRPKPPAPKTDPVPIVRGDPAPRPPEPPPPVESTTVLLEVRTDPSGVPVRIGNREWRTPLRLSERDLAPGQYELVIAQPGYQMLKERVTLTIGASPVLIEKKLQREARKVAFVLESEPAGARILLNNTDTGARTPHTVYQDEVNSLLAQVVLELPGYIPQTRSFEPTGETRRIPLTPMTGSFVVTGAASRATLLLFPVVPARNMKALTGLWSENPDSLEQALAALDPADAPRVQDRLKDLAARGEPRIRVRAAQLATLPASPEPLRPEKSLIADGRGVARIDEVWTTRRYRIFATSSRTTDYLSEELEPRYREETTLKAEMTAMATVSVAGVRPVAGQFKLVPADASLAVTVAPGAGAARIPAGPVSLRYVPPSGDPILREFTVNVHVPEAYELAGSLYLYCGEAWEKDGNVSQAIRSYTKVLEEKSFPTMEQPERTKLPGKIRALYLGAIAAREKAGKALGGDLSARLEEARGKAPAEAIEPLIELFTARDGLPALRGGAAALLASSLSKLGRPYEAMEWAERCARESFDPGHDMAGAVAAAIQGYPGLSERWETVAAAFEELRKPPPPAKSDPPAPPGTPGGRVGTLAVLSATYGLYVKLDQVMPLANGEVLEVYRENKIVGEVVVQRLLPPDKTYPSGAASCRRGQGEIEKGDEVRKKRM